MSSTPARVLSCMASVHSKGVVEPSTASRGHRVRLWYVCPVAQTDTLWYRRPLPRWLALRGVPLRRLWSLFVAAFLLFSVIGYYTDLMNDGNTPHAIVFLTAVYSGLNACLWLYVTSRWPAVAVLPLVLLQFFNGRILTAVSRWLIAHFALPYVPTREGIHFAATAIFISIIASYSFFIRYIRSEGQESLRLQNELELAHDIQKTLVPIVDLHTSCFEIYGISHPSERVGGDLVDAVLLASGEVIAYLADIAGHGLPASILMGRLKTATRTAILDAREGANETALPALLQRLNTVLPQVKEPQLYATFTGFRLGTDGSLDYALAASPPVFLWSAASAMVTRIDEPQLPLGLLPVSHFDSIHLQPAPGDLLVIATDGILEVAQKGGEEFGAARLKDILAAGPHLPLPQLAEVILSGTRRFGRQFDDQTMLLIRRL